MQAIKLIENEIRAYTSGEIQVSEGYSFSQYKLVKRIMLFANHIYPTGKTDSQGNYKYYFDIISPRVDSEVKNIDFDTKDILLYSDQKDDFLAVFFANAALKEWLRDNGQADELNDAIEEAAGWGNVVWKKVKGGYERVDLKNFYVVNQTAKTLKDTAVIERHEMTQSELRQKAEVWKNVQDVIENCKSKYFNATREATDYELETPTYEVYERNGEMSEKDLFEAMGKDGGDEDKFVLAKVIVAGLDRNGSEHKYILFASDISKMPYKEHHRGRYSGRWFRKGLIEALMDLQVRANEIGNQIARGLEWSSKTFFRTQDQLLSQNLLTDLVSGDVIKSQDLQQIEVRMNGFDQLIADWNRILELADRIANSYEVVTGEGMPSGTPFRLGALMNQNANKLFEYLREKLAISVKGLFEEWILPDVMSDLRSKDILRLTGGSDYLKRFHQMAVDAWYIENLPTLPPHDEQIKETLKAQKLEQIQSEPEALIALEKSIFEGVKPRVQVNITGEQTRLSTEMETLSTFIALEQDPIRRTALIEMAMAKSGIDIGNLPKMDPQAMMPQQKPTQDEAQPNPLQPAEVAA